MLVSVCACVYGCVGAVPEWISRRTRKKTNEYYKDNRN